MNWGHPWTTNGSGTSHPQMFDGLPLGCRGYDWGVTIVNNIIVRVISLVMMINQLLSGDTNPRPTVSTRQIKQCVSFGLINFNWFGSLDHSFFDHQILLGQSWSSNFGIVFVSSSFLITKFYDWISQKQDPGPVCASGSPVVVNHRSWLVVSVASKSSRRTGTCCGCSAGSQLASWVNSHSSWWLMVVN